MGDLVTDAGGNLVVDLHGPRFFTHILSDNRWKRGLPVQMASCWNGMAAMNAEGFRLGATFTAGSDGIDCRAASEVPCPRREHSGPWVDPLTFVLNYR